MFKEIKKILFFFFLVSLIIWPGGKAWAVCPVCTVAVGAGIGLSRWLGIDDTISGIWIGGLTVSFILWTLDWLNKKNYLFPGQRLLTTLFYYALVVFPLYFLKDIWHPLNTLWGINRLLLGILVGSLVFLLGVFSHNYLKRKNTNKSYFPFQKVALPVGLLLFGSLAFYLLIN